MVKRIYLNNDFLKGKTTLGSNLKANLYIHTFSHVLKGEKNLAMNKSFFGWYH
jgi:hypothetical protein